MKKYKRGVTLLEVIIGSIIISGIMVMLLVGMGRCSTVMSENPDVKADALRYAGELELKNPRVSYAEYDTDHDGYISCTIAADDRVLAVECAAGGPFNVQKGCRLQKPRIQSAD